MTINFNRVLVADPVDQACVELLQKNGFEVDCHYKLPKEQLLKEIKVCFLYKF